MDNILNITKVNNKLTTVNVVIKHTPDNDIISKVLFDESHSDYTKLTLEEDGYFTIVHLELMNQLYLLNNFIQDKKLIIYTDGKKFYKRQYNEDCELSIYDLMYLADNKNNIEDLILECTRFDQISIWFLENYYVSLVMNSLVKENCNSILIQLLKIYLDVIKYLSSHDRYLEACRLLEKVKNCKELYNNVKYENSKCKCLA